METHQADIHIDFFAIKNTSKKGCFEPQKIPEGLEFYQNMRCRFYIGSHSAILKKVNLSPKFKIQDIWQNMIQIYYFWTYYITSINTRLKSTKLCILSKSGMYIVKICKISLKSLYQFFIYITSGEISIIFNSNFSISSFLYH